MDKRHFSISNKTVPFFLLLIVGIAFGPLLTQLGFYWDDWAKILVARLWGLKDYVAYYAGDRPLSAWTHMLFTPLLGTTPLPWHVFTLALRWLSAWGMWWALTGLWPRARRMNLIAALLFAVYPAFISEPAAVTFHQQWLQYALFFFSLGCMIYANRLKLSQAGAGQPRPPRRFWILSGLSLVAMLLQMSVTEYFVPLELARPLILWFLVANVAAETGAPRPAFWQRTWQAARAWLPYLLVTVAFTVWRLFFIKLPVADPYHAKTLDALVKAPLSTLSALALTVAEDVFHIMMTVWSEPLNISFIQATPFTLASYAAGALAAALVVIYVKRLRDPGDDPDALNPPARDTVERWVGQAVALGIVALLLGPVPAWITGRQVVFDFHSDRYAMPAMFGAALLLAGIIAWIAQRRLQRGVLAAVLVGLAVIIHLRVANDYRWLWKSEQNFFWQLSWRAPGLKAPTALFMLDEPFANQGLFSTSAALNLLYPQPEGWGAPAPVGQPASADAKNLAYWIYTIRPRYNHAPDSYEIGLSSQFRTLKFSGATPDNSLLVHYDLSHGSCVWVISQRDKNNPYLPELVKTFIPISNPDRILPQAQTTGYPSTRLIGSEPSGSWCYYFEKADLARQMQDWATAARLYDEARGKGFSMTESGSESPYEWLPFVEGLARTGRWDDAASLTRQAYQQDSKYQPMLCDIWSNSALTGQAANTLRQEMACGVNASK